MIKKFLVSVLLLGTLSACGGKDDNTVKTVTSSEKTMTYDEFRNHFNVIELNKDNVQDYVLCSLGTTDGYNCFNEYLYTNEEFHLQMFPGYYIYSGDIRFSPKIKLKIAANEGMVYWEDSDTYTEITDMSLGYGSIFKYSHTADDFEIIDGKGKIVEINIPEEAWLETTEADYNELMGIEDVLVHTWVSKSNDGDIEFQRHLFNLLPDLNELTHHLTVVSEDGTRITKMFFYDQYVIFEKTDTISHDQYVEYRDIAYTYAGVDEFRYSSTKK